MAAQFLERLEARGDSPLRRLGHSRIILLGYLTLKRAKLIAERVGRTKAPLKSEPAIRLIRVNIDDTIKMARHVVSAIAGVIDDVGIAKLPRGPFPLQRRMLVEIVVWRIFERRDLILQI